MGADPYLYADTRVLKNKLGLRDHSQLQAIEFEMAALRAGQAMHYADSRRELDEATWKGVHRILFHDIYAWAGKFRTVELSKGSTVFAPVMALSGYADRHILPAFERRAAAAATDNAQFLAALAECWGELNYLHPFREGNGRSTQIFVSALAHRHGRDIDWSKVERDAETAAARAANEKDYGLYAQLLARVMKDMPLRK